MTVKIDKISPAENGETVRIDITISDGEHTQAETRIVSAAQFFDLGVSTGEIPKEKYECIDHLARVTAAIKKGIDLLSFAQNTEKGIARKLTAKGFDREISAEAAKFLSDVGYIDEKSQAEELCRELAERKLYGKARIKNELFKKEFSTEATENALLIDVDFAEVCAERIRKTIGIEPFIGTRDSRGKAIASLMRYGFSVENVRDALALIAEEM